MCICVYEYLCVYVYLCYYVYVYMCICGRKIRLPGVPRWTVGFKRCPPLDTRSYPVSPVGHPALPGPVGHPELPGVSPVAHPVPRMMYVKPELPGFLVCQT